MLSGGTCVPFVFIKAVAMEWVMVPKCSASSLPWWFSHPCCSQLVSLLCPWGVKLLICSFSVFPPGRLPFVEHKAGLWTCVYAVEQSNARMWASIEGWPGGRETDNLRGFEDIISATRLEISLCLSLKKQDMCKETLFNVWLHHVGVSRRHMWNTGEATGSEQCWVAGCCSVKRELCQESQSSWRSRCFGHSGLVLLVGVKESTPQGAVED